MMLNVLLEGGWDDLLLLVLPNDQSKGNKAENTKVLSTLKVDKTNVKNILMVSRFEFYDLNFHDLLLYVI